MALLEALNLKKYYGKGSYLVKAVDDISYAIFSFIDSHNQFLKRLVLSAHSSHAPSP